MVNLVRRVGWQAVHQIPRGSEIRKFGVSGKRLAYYGQYRTGLGRPPLPNFQTGKAHSSAQFPKQCGLLSR
jgi:hypothetical protein